MGLEPTACQFVLMLPEDRFVNCMYTVNITQLFKWLGIQFIVIFPHTACKLAHSKGVAFGYEKV